jgi:hypothetical protein
MLSLYRAALPALGAAVLFGASTPFAKQLVGSGAAFASPFLIAGLLYLGSALLTLMPWYATRLKSSGMPAREWPW